MSGRNDDEMGLAGCGQVAKWSNATDCKSVGFGLRRFKSFPAHEENAGDNDVPVFGQWLMTLGLRERGRLNEVRE